MSNQKAQEAYLRETKQLMRSKLEGHGVEITDDTPFRAYVNGIDEAVEKAVASVEPEGPEGVDELRKKIRLMMSGETMDSFELTAEDFAGVAVVRRYALYTNLNLTSVELHPDVLTIDPNAFNGCTKLETVRLPKKVKLQANCFGNCTGLKRVYLPAVTEVSECPQLIADKVFPTGSELPDLQFVVPDHTTGNIFMKVEKWIEVFTGRGYVIESQ